MNKKKAKRYCIAEGCRNNDRNSNHTFFVLPTRLKDTERVRLWLRLLGREDLLEKDLKKCTRCVCSAHFDPSSIKISKSLQENAVPTLLLANRPNSSSTAQPTSALEVEETAIAKSTKSVTSYSALPSGNTQIEDKVITSEKIVKKNTETQTNNQEPLSTKQTQTSELLTEGTPRKRKLSGELKECKRKLRKLTSEFKKIKQELKAKNKQLRAMMLMKKSQRDSKIL